MKATKKNASKVAAGLTQYVNTLLLAQAYARMEREKMNVVDRRLLNEGYYTDMDTHERITNPKKIFHMVEEDFAKYEVLRQGEIDRMGYNLPRDHCPALVAERLQTEAEWALIAAAEEFFPGMDNNTLLCNGLETRQKFLDLLVKLCINAPGYKAPSVAKLAG